MKRIPSILSILILLSLGACTLQMPGVEPPATPAPETQTQAEDLAAPTDTAAASPLPTFTATPQVSAEPLIAAQPATALPTLAMPAANPSDPYPIPGTPATQAPQPTALPPTTTPPTLADTPTPVIPFDPYTEYGKPKYQNRMEFPNLGEWADAETDELPDDRRIRLEFEDGELYVTGKRLDFSTWWFSYHTLRDAYIEMTFGTEDCSGEDAYGFIFRGPPHDAGESYGYAVSFSCNGNLWVLRLDGINPWDAVTLVEEEEVSAIHTGDYEENVIGVRSEGEQLTIFANGIQVAEVEDDEFYQGRVGVFVRAGGPGAYTYKVTNFAYWLLGVE